MSHHYTNKESIVVRTSQIQIKELELKMKQNIDMASLLNEYLVPLQAKLDIVLDDSDSYNFNGSTAREHRCEGMRKKSTRPHFSTAVVRECNKLCYLTSKAR